MGFFGSFLSAFGNFAPTLALDVISALINGPPPTLAKQLHDKTYSSNAYGNPWPRCRGTVRLQGKVVWYSGIRTSVHKTVGGGIFGIGSKSVYYNTYSASIFVGFGKKLGGGAANSILRVWTDGKYLFNGVASDATITGAVTASIVPTVGQPAGSLVLLVDVASGATLKLEPGDFIETTYDPNYGYEVQAPVNVTGPALSVAIPIWPPLRVSIPDTGIGTQLEIAGLNQSPYDLSSFDPDPHDGSHPDGGYPAPPGGIRFYLGSSTQEPDPTMVAQLGTGNVPGYRGLVAVMIHDLELANYGNRIPQFSGEIAFDTATGAYPIVGAYAVPVIHQVLGLGTPTSGASSLAFFNPLQNTPPYLFAMINVGGVGGGDKMLVRINSQTNQYETEIDLSTLVGGGIWLGPIVDSDGYVYLNSSAGSWTNVKIDGYTMAVVATVTSGLTDPSGMSLWDSQQSLFGNAVKVKGFVLMGTFGGIEFYDRITLQPYGVANPLSTGTVCIGYDKNGNPIITLGNSANPGTPYGGSGAEMAGDAFCVDANGNVWGGQKDTLSLYDGQFVSSINIPELLQGQFQEYLAQPGFARTDYSVSSVASSFIRALYYNAADNSIIIFGDLGVGKWDIATSALIATAAITDVPLSEYIDVQGTILLAGLNRFDVNTMSIVTTYNLGNWTAGGGPAGMGSNPALYDELTDSLYFQNLSDGLIYRAFLDLGAGDGIGLDSIVASLLNEAGYSSGQYDVSQLTSSGFTIFGVEFERESYLDSLKRLVQYALFDVATSNGKIVCVPRGNAPSTIPAIGSDTIPEGDLGALDSPEKYEPRVVETVEDPLVTPESVWAKYYDPLRDLQQATQYSKRISRPTAPSLVSARNVTNSRQQEDFTFPFTENATPVKQQTDRILWDRWTGRFARKFKLPYRYIQLDPTDVVLLNYKGVNLETRIEEADLGAGLAIQITGRSQDETVYSSATAALQSSSGGAPAGVTNPQPPTTNNNYTISPANPLSSPNSTTVDMAAFIASFTSGLRTAYAARTFTVANPGSGQSAVYYVTISDPSFTGDQPPGTASLTANIGLTPASVNMGQPGYINAGAVTVLGSGATTTTPNPLPGGQPEPGSGVYVGSIPFGPTTRGAFNLANTLGVVPSTIVIRVTVTIPTNPTSTTLGFVWQQQQAADISFIYLYAESAGLSGFVDVFA